MSHSEWLVFINDVLTIAKVVPSIEKACFSSKYAKKALFGYTNALSKCNKMVQRSNKELEWYDVLITIRDES